MASNREKVAFGQMGNFTTKEFQELQARSVDSPEEFWTELALTLQWERPWDKLLDQSHPPFSNWFVGGELNACFNCIDRHVLAGRGHKTALICDSPVTQTIQRMTFEQVRDKVSLLAGVLKSLGVGRGDVVVIYMPTILEGALAFLACARIGAVHNSIPGGLPAADLVLRLDHSQPVAIMLASHGYHADGWMNYKDEMDRALLLCSHRVRKCLVYQRTGMERVALNPTVDLDWEESLLHAEPQSCVPVPATDPLFILYSSGSTGVPKAVVHSLGSFMVRMALDPKLMLSPENGVFFGTTSLGWIAGHGLIVYGPTVNGLPGLLFEGDPLLLSDPRMIYRVAETHKATALMVRPGILRTLKGMDPDGEVSRDFDLSNISVVTVGGEFIDKPTVEWTVKSFRAPVMNLYAQTELSGVLSGQPDLSVYEKVPYTLTGFPFPGWNVCCMTENMKRTAPGDIGRLLVKLPLPPGAFSTLYKNDELCKKTYFEDYPGYFDTKDEGYVTEEGQIKIERRADDVIKAGPIYVSASDIETVLLSNQGVSEVSVVAQPHNIHREMPIAFVVLRSGQKPDSLRQELVDTVRGHFGKSMPFQSVVFVAELPRTRTGKINRPGLAALLKKIPVNTGNIENPGCLAGVEAALKEASVI